MTMNGSQDWKQQERVTLITGATGYLGRALTIGFANAGATLFLTGRSEDSLAKLAAEPSLAKSQVHCFAADLTDAAAADRMVGQALVSFGRIDNLIINAGTLADGLVAGLTDDEMEQVYQLNYLAAFRTLRAVLRPMILNRSGNVVVVSSTAAQRPGAGQAAYAASKAALESLVRVTARETAARGIRVNAVAPGLLNGGMASRILDEELETARTAIPMRRPGEAAEIVPVILFLVSPMSSYVTGQIWSVDGGFTA
jgi:3-oxoacyl-[acyl-carrier protein] reductase